MPRQEDDEPGYGAKKGSGIRGVIPRAVLMIATLPHRRELAAVANACRVTG